MERAAEREVAEQLFGATPQARLLLLRAAWPQAVGPELARRTEVVALEGSALRIRVPDAGWRKGLVRMKHEILGRLRGIAGGLAPRALGFVEAAPAAIPAPTEPPPPVVRGSAPPAPALLAQAACIVDAELRDRFLASAARYLDRFKLPPGGKTHA